MKKAFLFIIIFGFGALCYALLTHLFAPANQNPVSNDTTDRTPTATVEETHDETPIAMEEPAIEDEVVIAQDGSLLDGPFTLFAADGTQTDATVRLIRSPEERLMQFENFTLPYSPASHVYFASDKNATEYFNLGPAKFSEDYFVYGIPLDADLSSYNYILIYQTQLDEVEYYARIQ